MKTVFVLVDALKSLYLTEEYMPFLYSLSKRGYYIKQIIPCSGFCERSEIFSGLDGYDTGNFTAIGFLPEKSPYHNNSAILKLFGMADCFSSRVARKVFSKWRICKRKRLNAYRIPFGSLSKFALTEDGDTKLISHRDIFQSLEENGMTYSSDGFTSLSDLGRRSKLSVTELAEREIGRGVDFIPLYIGVIDSAGHRYGDDIVSMKPILRDVDSQLEEIHTAALRAGYSFCALGDHGMVPVKHKIDVQAIIKQTGLSLNRDYEVFYDSTMARFWFYNSRAKETIIAVLNDNLQQYGFIVDKDNCREFRVPLDITNKDGHPVYGDIVWCANPGVLISPDYFHCKAASENGMHGYIQVVEGHGTGLFVMMSSETKHEEIEKAPSSQICGELCKSLDIDYPNNKEWKRIV